MKAGEIEIYKNILCTLDAALPMTNVTEIKLDTEDALYGYIAKLCAAALSDTGAKTATYGADDYAALLVPTEPEGMEAFAEEVSGRIYELIRDNADFPALRLGKKIIVDVPGLYKWLTERNGTNLRGGDDE